MVKYNPNYKSCPKTFKSKLREQMSRRIELFFKEYNDGTARTNKEWMQEFKAWSKRHKDRKGP